MTTLSTPNNIQKFNELAGKTFNLLYESFPVRRALLFHQNYGLLEYGNAFNEDMVNVGDSEERNFIKATVEWLVMSGYVSIANIDEYGVHGAVLTAKGLEVMNLVPETIGGKKNELTVAGILREGLKAGEAKAVAEGLSWLFRKGLEFVPIIVHSLSAG